MQQKSHQPQTGYVNAFVRLFRSNRITTFYIEKTNQKSNLHKNWAVVNYIIVKTIPTFKQKKKKLSKGITTMWF